MNVQDVSRRDWRKELNNTKTALAKAMADNDLLRAKLAEMQKACDKARAIMTEAQVSLYPYGEVQS